MARLSVLVPCLDEALALPALVARVHAVFEGDLPAGMSGELVLVDDGSSDGTWEAMRRLSSEYPALITIRHERRSGIPAAWRSALERAQGDWVCVLDGDLQYQPEEIPRLLRVARESGADVAQGARSLGRRPRDFRLILSRGLSTLLNGLFGMSLADNKSGFFLCRREVLAELLAFRGTYRHWQCFVMVAAHHRGYRIRAFETPFHPRRTGRSAFGRLGLVPACGVALDLFTAFREYGPGASRA